MRSLYLNLAMACVLCLCGCVATETGNPTFHPTADTASGALSGEVVGDPMLPAGTLLIIDGEPGSVSPPTGQVWIWNLDEQGPPGMTDVQPDGSFRASVEGLSGDRVRQHVVEDGAVTSLPVDFVVTDAGLSPLSAALACLTLDPIVVVLSGADGIATLRVDSTCATSVTRPPARLRTPSAPYTVDDPGSPILPDGSIEITVQSTSIGGEPEVVLIPIDSPSAALRAATLFGVR